MQSLFPFKIIIFCALMISGCKGNFKKTESEKIKAGNLVIKKVYRNSSDQSLLSQQFIRSKAPSYPWETVRPLDFPTITKGFFRCKGSSANEAYLVGEERLFDCSGSARHSLPIIDGKEFVYPILIDLLNHLQETLQARVVVTCGHRCPQHSRYSDPSNFNATSKHMVGAEVDFYVEGYESQPDLVVDVLMQYYQSKLYENKKGYAEFSRYTKNDLNVSTQPWYNREIFIKLYQSHEGRDRDNTHPWPYIGVQVRYDKEEKKLVTYTWQQAFYSYLRY